MIENLEMPESSEDRLPLGIDDIVTPIQAQQLLIDAVRIMCKSGTHRFMVFEGTEVLGTLSASEISKFLYHNKQKDLIAHKLCYTMESFLSLTRRKLY
ncbi:hypothetical protein PBAL39_20119 [Pedobacter sp. BAL39]|uniref:hypothetical protein n=1 Tax=Pedobacter sp. BAL39 TaxID=391596 RepID=UPI0001559845|nr:hypothetical protein [Pedobacter sp. BAL39]EDM36225.1 hypothetical protein PBAL39_20119 [Pedobacter sp. BAL39]